MNAKLSTMIMARMHRAHLGIRGIGRQSPAPFGFLTLNAMVED